MNKNKLNMSITIVGSFAILMIGGLVFIQMYKNHQANQLIIEKCFDNFDEVGEVVIKKGDFWSPVSCEKNSIDKIYSRSFFIHISTFQRLHNLIFDTLK